jgi:signal peptidase I
MNLLVWALLAWCVPLTAAAGWVAALRRRYVVVTVCGLSMTPAFHPGDRVLVRRGHGDRLTAGALVVLPPPAARFDYPRQAAGVRDPDRWLMKRLAAIPDDAVPEAVRAAVPAMSVVPAGMAVVLSDNPAGTDSREWGFVPLTEIAGAVVRILPSRGGNPPWPATHPPLAHPAGAAPDPCRIYIDLLNSGDMTPVRRGKAHRSGHRGRNAPRLRYEVSGSCMGTRKRRTS